MGVGSTVQCSSTAPESGRYLLRLTLGLIQMVARTLTSFFGGGQTSCLDTVKSAQQLNPYNHQCPYCPRKKLVHILWPYLYLPVYQL